MNPSSPITRNGVPRRDYFHESTEGSSSSFSTSSSSSLSSAESSSSSSSSSSSQRRSRRNKSAPTSHNNNNNNNKKKKAPKPSQRKAAPKPPPPSSPIKRFEPNTSGVLPVITANEVIVSRTLGKGNFCTVGAVKGLPLRVKKNSSSNKNSDKKEQARQQLARRFADYEQYYATGIQNRNKAVPASPVVLSLSGRKKKSFAGAGGELPSDPAQPPRLALKQVQPNLSAPKYERAILDLTSELAILSQCQHRHIITVHAVGYETTVASTARSNTNNDNDDDDDDHHQNKNRVAFLLLDQLRSTLSNKVYTWREKRGALGMFLSVQDWNQLWLERLIVLLRITDAVQYLHAQNLLHRDLNLQNIGFDADNVVKVFDFGLARQLNPNNVYSGQGVDDDDALYKDMTAMTGTMRYMAGEVALGLPYGKKADVHSLAIIFYEVLSLFKAYANVTLSANEFTKDVIQAGVRPSMEAIWWPASIKQLITEMWETDSAKRPSSQQVHDRLEAILRDSTEEELYPNKSHWAFGRDMNKTLTISTNKIKSWATGSMTSDAPANMHSNPHGSLD